MACPNCIICSEVFGQDTEVIVTRCGHLFHNNCILRWFQRSETCPQCRCYCTDNTNLKVHLNWDPTDTPSSSSTPTGARTIIVDINGTIHRTFETRGNHSEANEDILILTQAQQQSIDMIYELQQKILDKDGLINSYIDEAHRLQEDIDMLQTRITSLESEHQTCENKKMELSNMADVLKIDLSNEREIRKKQERSEQILIGQLKKMRSDLNKEAQLRKNSEERFSKLENKLIEAAVGREKEQDSSSENKCTISKTSPNTETELFRLAKNKAQEAGWKFVWEKKGKILARKNATSEVLYIGNVRALRSMV